MYTGVWSVAPKAASYEVDWSAVFGCVGTLAVVAFLVLFVWWGIKALMRHDAKSDEERRLKNAAISEAEIQWAETQARMAAAASQARWDDLCRRFGPQIAARILAGDIWQGQTSDMLVAVLGRPDDIDEKVLKTKAKYTYKYAPAGVRRYGLRVMIEDGVVVGWEDKR
jgi:hypothetical protein